MRIALLAPIAWRTPPLHYGPWEQVVSLLCEGLVERFSQRRMVHDYLDVYERVLSGEPKARRVAV